MCFLGGYKTERKDLGGTKLIFGWSCHLANESLSRFLFSQDFSGTIADADMINTSPEPFQPKMCLLGVTKRKLKI